VHRLLSRQVQKTLGRLDGHAPEITQLLAAVEAAYLQADEDRAMLERSMELSSRELLERNGELTAAEEKYRSIFENATEGIFQLSADGLITVANPALAKILGCDSPAILTHGAGALTLREAVLAARWAELEAQGALEVSDVEVRRWDGQVVVVSASLRVLRDAQGRVQRIDGTLRDVTLRARAEAEREELNRKLVDASRRAGMAEVATGVLHNVGNVLNSMNVSISLVSKRLSALKLPSLAKAARMLHDKPVEERGRFVSADDKGKKLPEFFVQLSDQLSADQKELEKELAALQQHLEHVKGVIAMQQSYARASGVTERVRLGELVEEALRLEGAALDRHGLEVVRAMEETPPMLADKHRLLQILVNLITNAKQAMSSTSEGLRVLTLRSGVMPGEAPRVFLEVQDTGVGIAPENLTKIFNHGFTTTAEGHGFGLHASANSAKVMKGSLSARSEGPGRGACFRLELPVVTAVEAEHVAQVRGTVDLPRRTQ
jgi:PAS domain S-box-containing protein